MAPSRYGGVLQTLVGAHKSFAFGTVMVHVPQSVHKERDETAAQYAPEQEQAPTGEPGENTSFIGELSHNHPVTVRTAHLHWAVEKDWQRHVDRLHSNCLGVGDRHWLGVECRRVHILSIWPVVSPVAGPGMGAGGVGK